MSEVIISDFNKDTLEVAFLLSKIFELLMEADQIGGQGLEYGGMSLEDKEKYDRFNRTFTDLYTHKLLTVQNISAPKMAEKSGQTLVKALKLKWVRLNLL